MSKTEERKPILLSLLVTDHLRNHNKTGRFWPTTSSSLDDSEAEACSQPVPGTAAVQPTILRVFQGPLAALMGRGYLESLCTRLAFETWCAMGARGVVSRQQQLVRGQRSKGN